MLLLFTPPTQAKKKTAADIFGGTPTLGIPAGCNSPATTGILGTGKIWAGTMVSTASQLPADRRTQISQPHAQEPTGKWPGLPTCPARRCQLQEGGTATSSRWAMKSRSVTSAARVWSSHRARLQPDASYRRTLPPFAAAASTVAPCARGGRHVRAPSHWRRRAKPGQIGERS